MFRLVKSGVSTPTLCKGSYKYQCRFYGILELQEKYGNQFQRIQQLNKHDATPLERKIYAFANRVSKSPKFNFEMIDTNGNEIMETDLKTKPNMDKIVSETYHWNPYNIEERGPKKLHRMKEHNLDPIPEKYKQAGFGIQNDPRPGTSDIYKMFPNNDVIKHIVGGQDMRVNELGHLLTNPLKELGYRQHNIAQGRDYNVMERIISQFNDDVVETWHGSDAIVDQETKLPQTPIVDENTKIESKTIEQVMMRRLRQQAEDSYFKLISLPPFKYGYENVPIIVRQSNYHSPDMLGDAKRTRELKADMSIFMKHVFGEKNGTDNKNQNRNKDTNKNRYDDKERFVELKKHFGPRNFDANAVPLSESKYRGFATKQQLFDRNRKIKNNMSKRHELACKLIGGKNYNSETTEFRLKCNDNYFYFENERKIVNLFSKLISEIDRLAQCIDEKSMKLKVNSWEDYKKKYYREWKNENLRRKWKKHRWTMEMLALPEHVRSNYNLYQSGPRMKKMANYLDFMYDNLVDAGNILQRQGPRSPNSFKYISNYMPKNNEFLVNNIDKYPNNVSDYCMNHRFRYRRPKAFKVRKFDEKDSKNATFGLRSGYMIPHSEVGSYLGDWHVPLAQPFVGLRLRSKRMTPNHNPYLMKIYRNRKETPNIGKKLIFGNVQASAQSAAAEQAKLLEEAADLNPLKRGHNRPIAKIGRKTQSGGQRKEKRARTLMTTGNKRTKEKYKKIVDALELARLRRKQRRERLIKTHGERHNTFTKFYRTSQKDSIERAAQAK